MKQPTQNQRIVNYLREHRGTSFTAREIAQALIAAWPAIYQDKMHGSGLDERQLVGQVVAEIGASKASLQKLEPSLEIHDLPRPRRFCVPAEPETGDHAERADGQDAVRAASATGPAVQREHDLYVPFIQEYLHAELGLHAMRIREGSSSGSGGAGGNRWLHPDIVAMESINRHWPQHVSDAAKANGSTSIRLWSFEVKKALSMGNVRECFFQAVSNSSWAHEGYLVATSIDSRAVAELRMLSALHGIGVMVFDYADPTQSDIMLPARSRADADWQSVSRLARENRDFARYMEKVNVYLQTGSLSGWDSQPA